MSERDGGRDGSMNDEAFVERVAQPLRESEELSAAFGARVMDAVRVESRVRHSVAGRTTPRVLEAVPVSSPWWRRERSLRVTPLVGLAAAASILVAAAFGAFAATRLALPKLAAPSPVAVAQAPVAAPAADTVHVVRFVFVDSTARAVSLVGDFNAWSKESTPLLRDAASGVWTASVVLPRGRHEYAFIVNGERWVADPYAARVLDDFGTESSVVTVGVRKS